MLTQCTRTPNTRCPDGGGRHHVPPLLSVRQRVDGRLDMPTYRGNRGNLLQHWVLVELLSCIREGGIARLCFVDAYSMSPSPTRSKRAATDQTAREFDHVRSRLDRSSSAFEQAWLTLSQDLASEYPSSAAFVRRCWPERVHFLLCEADPATADDIERWLSRLDKHHLIRALQRRLAPSAR
jgi:hypothetical protein